MLTTPCFALIINKCSVGAENKAFKNAPLAQLVEHLTLNQGVPGSNP